MNRFVRMIFVLGLAVLALIDVLQAAEAALVLDFSRHRDGEVMDTAGAVRGQLRGNTSVKQLERRHVLELSGARAKGVLDLGKDVANSPSGTIRLRVKPATVGGVLVGRYGALNLELVKKTGAVRFGVKLAGGEKGTWISASSDKRAAKVGQWLDIKASWGEHGVLLYLDDKLVARTQLPKDVEWFSDKGRLVLGSYTWPGGYDVWYAEALIDRFEFAPTQQAPPKAEAGAIGPVYKPMELVLPKTPVPHYGDDKPAVVTGRVVLDRDGDGVAQENDPGLAGVSVSDGYHVVKTDARGRYRIEPHRLSVFVQVTRPPGHDVVGFDYAGLAPRVDFCFRRVDVSEDRYTFVHVTDTHVSTDPRSIRGVTQFVREVNALEPRPRFVINSGDLVNLDKKMTMSPEKGRQYFRQYAGLMNNLAMPHYNVAGDHTDSSYRLNTFAPDDPRRGKPLFWEFLGPHLRSFEYGKLHFITVDNVYHIRGKVEHKLIPEHLAWLKADMAARTEGAHVVTTSEKSLDRAIDDYDKVARTGDIAFQLIGDDHILSYRNRPVPTRIGGALSGTWWNGPCPDLSPQGYLVYQVRGTELTCFYKGLGQDVAIVKPAYGDKLSGSVVLEAHVVQPGPDDGPLRYAVNGGPWKPMAAAGEPFYRVLYRATIDTTVLPDGLSTIRVTGPGESRVQQVVVAVDNQGKPASVDADGQLTFDVGRLIAAAFSPAGEVTVRVNGKSVGSIAAGHRGACSFKVPAGLLNTVNTLGFDFERPGDRMSLTDPVLEVDGRQLLDPYSQATRRVRLGHWSEKIVNRSGFIAGDLRWETAFALHRNRFHFALASARAEPAGRGPAAGEVVIWQELEALLPQRGWEGNGYRPQGADKEDYWTGRGSARSLGEPEKPLTWTVELKKEMTDDGIDERTRRYAVWVHQYGYRNRELTVEVNGKSVGTIRSPNTEEFDNRGRYVAPGRYVWQKVGEVTLAGGRHVVTFRPGKGQKLLLNAVVLTSDLELVPRRHALLDKATREFARTVEPEPEAWSAFVEPMADAYGLTRGYTSMSYFRLGHNGKGTLHDRKVTAEVVLPEGVELVTASQRLVGENWVYPKEPFTGWRRITIDRAEITEQGRKMTRCDIGLSYLPDNGRYELMLYCRTSLEPGTRVPVKLRLRWDGGQGEPVEVDYRVVDIPRVKPMKEIVIGSAGGNWDIVHPAKWPDFAELLTHGGHNAVTLWGAFHKPRPDMDLRLKTARAFLAKGLQTFDNFSPWYHTVLPPKTIATGAAADIDGKLYLDYKGRTIPCPSYVEGNPLIEKQAEWVKGIAERGITGLLLDDERFNLKGTDICFCPRCKAGYLAFLKREHPKLKPVPLTEVVRHRKQWPDQFEAWLVFRARGNSRRIGILRNAFVQAAESQNHKSTFGKPMVSVLVSPKDGSLRESRLQQLWDLPSLTDHVDYVCPMIYPTRVRYTYVLPQRLSEIRRNLGDPEKLWVTLNTGYSGSGRVPLEDKEVIQYGTLEALMSGCRGVTYWNGYTTFDPLSLRQIALAVKMVAPYESLLLEGTVGVKSARSDRDSVNLSMVMGKKDALLLVSDYTETPGPVEVKLDGGPWRLKDTRTGRPVETTDGGTTFTVRFDTHRATLFHLQR